jgi:GTP cyclohydrolase I
MCKNKTSNIEVAKPGHANGISLQLAAKHKDLGSDAKLTEQEKEVIIERAAKAYGEFLTALGCDWENDPNSDNTPRRVAKAYVKDLWRGRYENMSNITAFPADGYNGYVQENNIPLISQCSHHHQTITGKVSISYIASSEGTVVGLSKLNRIVEHFGRRGAIQEQLTVAIHNAVSEICEGNLGVAVHIQAVHNCVSCRGVGHQGASMATAKLSGAYFDNDNTRAEFYKSIELSALLNR